MTHKFDYVTNVMGFELQLFCASPRVIVIFILKFEKVHKSKEGRPIWPIFNVWQQSIYLKLIFLWNIMKLVSVLKSVVDFPKKTLSNSKDLNRVSLI